MTLQQWEAAAKLRQVAQLCQVCQVAGWLLSPAVSIKQALLPVIHCNRWARDMDMGTPGLCEAQIWPVRDAGALRSPTLLLWKLLGPKTSCLSSG